MSFSDRDLSESSENEDIIFFENFSQDHTVPIKNEEKERGGETDLRSELNNCDPNGFFKQEFSREELRIILTVFGEREVL